MKKILTGLVLSSSLLFAGNYLTVSTQQSETKFSDQSFYQGSYDTQQYVIELYAIGDDFIFKGGYAYLPSQTSSFTGGSSRDNYDYERDAMAVGFDFIYKLNLEGNFFVGPMVSVVYSFMVNEKAKNITKGTTTTYQSDSSGSSIPLGFMAGFDYMDDSFAYITYELDSDIKDSDDHDDKEIGVGLTHSFGSFLFDVAYTYESNTLDTIDSDTSIRFGVGVQF